MKSKIILATRSTPLAVKQAELAIDYLSSKLPGLDAQMLKMSTTGDRQKDWSLQEKGGKGLFTKELEEALMNGTADVAVHSAKDMPTEQPENLVIAGYLPRADARDVWVARNSSEVINSIATGSPRRRGQLKPKYKDVNWSELRGTVKTRLEKIARGDADATVLARAGLDRLGINAHAGLQFHPLALEHMVPAAGQGAIAIQCHVSFAPEIKPLLDADTYKAVTLERMFLSELGGGCHTAFAVHYAAGILYLFDPERGFKQLEVDVLLEKTPAIEVVKKIIKDWL